MYSLKVVIDYTLSIKSVNIFNRCAVCSREINITALSLTKTLP